MQGTDFGINTYPKYSNRYEANIERLINSKRKSKLAYSLNTVIYKEISLSPNAKGNTNNKTFGFLKTFKQISARKTGALICAMHDKIYEVINNLYEVANKSG